MGQIYYSRVVPNSHSYTSLVNILYQHEYSPEELTREHLIIGLENTILRGGEFKFKPKLLTQSEGAKHYFTSLEQLFTYVKYIDEWSLEKTIKILNDTLNCGYDLVFKEIKERDMKREEVYKNIDKEREYQDLKWDQRRTKDDVADADKAVAEWLNYMAQHLSDAQKGVYNLDTNEALEQIRKVVALGVCALEIHGCPERLIPKEF